MLPVVLATADQPLLVTPMLRPLCGEFFSAFGIGFGGADLVCKISDSYLGM